MNDKTGPYVSDKDNIVPEKTVQTMRAAIKSAFPSAQITTRSALNGVCFRVIFQNGFAGSVIRNEASYGFKDGLWEVAVMRQTPMGLCVCCDTPITDDVIGFLDEPGVIEILKRIESLSCRKKKKK